MNYWKLVKTVICNFGTTLLFTTLDPTIYYIDVVIHLNMSNVEHRAGGIT